MKTNKYGKVLPAIVGALVFALAGCGGESPDEASQAQSFELREVEPGMVQVTVDGPGVLDASRIRTLRSVVSGRVLSIARTGERVAEGDALVILDSSDLMNAYRQASLNLEQGELEAERAILTLESARERLADEQQLFDRGAISAEQLGSAEEAVRNAGYALRLSEIRVDQLSLSLEKAAAELESATIVAPFDGVVLKHFLEPGDSASSSTVLLEFADDYQLRLVAEVDEFDIGKLAEGMRVSISSDALGDTEISSRVELISPAAEVVNNISIFSVSALVDNSDLLLRPGMSADMSILAASDRGIIVPSRLIETVRGRSYIKVWENEEEVLRRIETGANDGINTAVLSGLEAGESIVVPLAPALILPGVSDSGSSGSSIVPISVPGTGSK